MKNIFSGRSNTAVIVGISWAGRLYQVTPIKRRFISKMARMSLVRDWKGILRFLGGVVIKL